MQSQGANINPDPDGILNEYFGYDNFRENQREIIETVMDGEDAFVLMPTGSGKSICYQIPSMLKQGVGIVISPLIALMEDQVKALRQNGVKAACLNSTLSFQQVRTVQERVADGRLDILYVAPERLLTPDFQHFLTRVKPGLFAIDEAHCVSQWGHDFRPEYLRINEVTHKFPNTPRIALTATADEVTRKDILEKLELRQAKVFISSFDRPNIRYHVRVKNRDKHQLLAFIRGEHPVGSGIVYARTRKRTESIAEWLSQQGVDALPYHAGLPPEVRMGNQKRFQENSTRVMVATIAFGMGIDKPDVRFVAHVDLPGSVEAYYQETGRAGRDGQPADAWMVYSLADVTALRRLFELSEGSDEFKNVRRQKLEALLGYCESVVCRRKLLLNYFGEAHDGACGGCDNCLHPVQTWDGTVAAQKALSCVYRTGERFGAGHLINVLMGKSTRQIERWDHARIKTFGVGRELDKNTWMSVFRQLLSAGLLSVDMGKISGFLLTDESWKVLKGKRDVFFRKDSVLSAKSVEKPIPGTVIDVFADEEEQTLFETLRKLRTDISKHLGVPPYIIFQDKSLKEMVSVKPSNTGEFLKINGVGEIKAQKYAEIFLACIRGEDTDIAAYLERKGDAGDADAKDETSADDADKKKQLIIKLLKEGNLSSAEIAETVGVSPPTVWAYKAHVTMGKYDTPHEKEPAGEDLSTDLNPYIKKVRQTHPGAYAPWTEDDDRKLEQDWRNGVSIAGLADSFGRTRGAIESRIKKLNLKCRQEHAPVKPVPKESFQKSMVCFAVSRKYKGYCVAGKEWVNHPKSPWIRPVGSSAMGELPLKTIRMDDGNKPAFLDIVKIAVKKPLPHYYQTENYLIDDDIRWEKVGRLRPEELVDYRDPVDTLWENGYHSVNGMNDRIPIEVANERCESSLVLIEPRDFRLFLATGLTFKQKIRAEFMYNGDTYNLSVTDPFVENIYADQVPGRYKIEDRPLYLCISLGEPLKGFCYKLVAGVIGFKE